MKLWVLLTVSFVILWTQYSGAARYKIIRCDKDESICAKQCPQNSDVYLSRKPSWNTRCNRNKNCQEQPCWEDPFIGCIGFSLCAIEEGATGPTAAETEAPTAEETEAPTAEETEAPTAEETEAPTAEETEAPTAEETEAPTAEETEAPTAEETEAPTAEETEAPTAEETEAPTAEETEAPTAEETEAPAAAE